MGKLKRKNKTGELTPKQIEELRLKDFMGELTEEEIPIAKKYGVFEWHDWKNKTGPRVKKNITPGGTGPMIDVRR